VIETHGIVVDSETKEPLDSVTYYMHGKAFHKQTKKNGGFDINEVSGICNCMDAVFEKQGYKKIVINIPDRDTVVVKMEKIK
jgi:hypothetical protein